MVNLKNWFPFRFPRATRNPETPARADARKPLPLADLATMRDEMDRMFDRLWSNPISLLDAAATDRWFGDFSGETFVPKLDVTDDPAFLKVTLEAPGLDAKDLQIEVQDGAMVISGEKRHEETAKDEGCYRTERSYGFFRRAIPLPAEVDANKADAKMDKGVLTIKVPKTEAAKKPATRVTVKS